mmetsp:Transcript_22626/g.57305  ORF Transcript_22626/g.57305 Transcript_22626/m.57305 type:complete len:296 (+) Transcript_22626:284-1171(+)|eukprot:CAMPEP_0178992746 /NCGR_PEP_ID=MMETSP0795-20121207/6291_1 /TAXON_ID=88552 /ORGANISM="Amoebophrya sp., Strain Ameob2" /LENGTH=295 /DNA_ID=CAMNT_0020684673 /DNA_START=301 /DNA_END=1188 /DNA_ORIENTATION=+
MSAPAEAAVPAEAPPQMAAPVAPPASTAPPFTLAILGATGQTGKWALKGALQRGYACRVLARKAAKVKDVYRGCFPKEAPCSTADLEKFDTLVTVVEGNLEVEKIAEVCRGADAICSFLGMVQRGVPVTKPGVDNTVAALKKLAAEGEEGKVKLPARFLSMSTIGINDGRAIGNKAWGRCVMCCTKVHPGLKSSFADLAAGELSAFAAQKDAGLVGTKVTVIRCAILGQNDAKGFYVDLGAGGEKTYETVGPGESGQGKTSFTVDRQCVAQGFLDIASGSGEFDGKNIAMFQKRK